MKTSAARFPRVDRLLRSSEFQRVGRHGKRAAGRCFVLLWTPHEIPTREKTEGSSVDAPSAGRRLGVTVSRKVGNAVVRNRVKRSIREWYRLGGNRRLQGLDVVVIARLPARDLCGTQIWGELDALAPNPGEVS